MKIVNEIHPQMFREYDLRGIYGEDITEDVAYTIGKSFGSYILEMGSQNTLIGHDNRLSSPVIANALIQGVKETGVHVIDLGLVTTPMYYYAKYKLKMKTGIMITASHNPKEYNGFKISFSEIGNAYGEMIQAFRRFTEKGLFQTGNGTVEFLDIRKDYIEQIKSSLNFGSHPIKAVLDCGNGTGSIIIKDIFDELGMEYYPLYCESDGNFPNHHPDPSVSSNMVDLGKKVVELGYDIGIGIDGDADRIGIVDERGNLIATDLYMIIVYRYLCQQLRTKRALFDVKCSKALIDEVEKLGIEPVMYRTGNSYTNMKMQEGDFDFGGEYSGHVFFRDKFPGFDDGIYGGLRMIEILSQTGKTVSSLLEGIPTYYSTEELKFFFPDHLKFDKVERIKEYAKEKGYTFLDIDGVRVTFDDGWALVRASNTGPNLTARFEATTKERLEQIKQEFTSLLEHS